jgi:hypothetical protein
MAATWPLDLLFDYPLDFCAFYNSSIIGSYRLNSGFGAATENVYDYSTIDIDITYI